MPNQKCQDPETEKLLLGLEISNLLAEPFAGGGIFVYFHKFDQKETEPEGSVS